MDSKYIENKYEILQWLVKNKNEAEIEIGDDYAYFVGEELTLFLSEHEISLSYKDEEGSNEKKFNAVSKALEQFQTGKISYELYETLQQFREDADLAMNDISGQWETEERKVALLKLETATETLLLTLTLEHQKKPVLESVHQSKGDPPEIARLEHDVMYRAVNCFQEQARLFLRWW